MAPTALKLCLDTDCSILQIAGCRNANACHYHYPKTLNVKEALLWLSPNNFKQPTESWKVPLVSCSLENQIFIFRTLENGVLVEDQIPYPAFSVGGGNLLVVTATWHWPVVFPDDSKEVADAGVAGANRSRCVSDLWDVGRGDFWKSWVAFSPLRVGRGRDRGFGHCRTRTSIGGWCCDSRCPIFADNETITKVHLCSKMTPVSSIFPFLGTCLVVLFFFALFMYTYNG